MAKKKAWTPRFKQGMAKHHTKMQAYNPNINIEQKDDKVWENMA